MGHTTAARLLHLFSVAVDRGETGSTRSSAVGNQTRVLGGGFTVSQMVGRLVCVVITFVFAIVGSFVGAMTGALIGLATESGLFRGAGIGSISGAVFSIEAVSLWHSNGSAIWSALYMMDIVTSLFSGRLVREKVGPAVQSAVQSQMSAVDSPFIEALDIFDTGGTDGVPKDSVDKIPTINITARNNVDASGDQICCSVCLQDFQVGETVRGLPHCQHMFHLPCIDGWLISHGSCPLCRRDVCGPFSCEIYE